MSRRHILLPREDSEQSRVGGRSSTATRTTWSALWRTGSERWRAGPSKRRAGPANAGFRETIRHPRRCRCGSSPPEATRTPPRSFSLPSGAYDAVFTLEATKAAADHNQDTDAALEPVTLIRLEYREGSSSAWKTHAVSTLQLTGSGGAHNNLPTADQLLRGAPVTGDSQGRDR